MVEGKMSLEEKILASCFRANARGATERTDALDRLEDSYVEWLRQAGVDDFDARFSERLNSFREARRKVEDWIAGQRLHDPLARHYGLGPAPPDHRPVRGGFALRRTLVRSSTGLIVALFVTGSAAWWLLPQARGDVVYRMTPGDLFSTPKGTTAETVSDGVLLRFEGAAASSKDLIGAEQTLSSDIEGRVSGKVIRVTVSARRVAGARGSPEMAVAYFTNGVGNSGWHRFALGETFAPYAFTYKVPQRRGDPSFDFLSICADTEGRNRGIVVNHIEVVLEPDKSGGATENALGAL